MMPRMARDIMGRRRQLPISQPCLPIWLPFEIHAVATGAFSAVNSPTDVDHSGIGVIDYRRSLGCDGDKEHRGDQSTQNEK